MKSKQNPRTPGLQQILLLIFIFALLGLVGLIISWVSDQGLANNSGNKISAAQSSYTPLPTNRSEGISTKCTAIVLAPEYSPKHFYPPSIIIYDSRPFLITWAVVNTSEDCTWATLQLLTEVDGQPKTLNIMPPGRKLPMIDEEFAMYDKDNLPVDHVNPRQRVTITVQIDGLDLVSSNGKIDRTFDMIIKEQIVEGGRLVAQQSQWVVLIMPSNTPTITPIPSVTPTITSTATPTNTLIPTRTQTTLATRTRTAVRTVAPPSGPTRTYTQPPPVGPSKTPTLPLPPIDTPTLPPP
jgi:hypothetical protein